MELQKRSFRRPSSLRSSWMSVWMAFTGGGGLQHPSPRRSGNVVGVCLGGIRCPGSSRTSWVSVWVAFTGGGGVQHPSPRRSENVVAVCLGGNRCPGSPRTSWVSVWVAFIAQAVRERRGSLSVWHFPEVECSIRCPGGPETSWKSVWVAFVAQAVRECRGCLSGWHAMELQERSFRRPSSLRKSWMSVWVAFTRGEGVQHPSPRWSGNVMGVCLGGIHLKRRRGASFVHCPETSWVSVCNSSAVNIYISF